MHAWTALIEHIWEKQEKDQREQGNDEREQEWEQRREHGRQPGQEQADQEAGGGLSFGVRTAAGDRMRAPR